MIPVQAGEALLGVQAGEALLGVQAGEALLDTGLRASRRVWRS